MELFYTAFAEVSQAFDKDIIGASIGFLFFGKVIFANFLDMIFGR